MRPGHFYPGKFTGAEAMFDGYVGFNEAGAFLPRKIGMGFGQLGAVRLLQ